MEEILQHPVNNEYLPYQLVQESFQINRAEPYFRLFGGWGKLP